MLLRPPDPTLGTAAPAEDISRLNWQTCTCSSLQMGTAALAGQENPSHPKDRPNSAQAPGMGSVETGQGPWLRESRRWEGFWGDGGSRDRGSPALVDDFAQVPWPVVARYTGWIWGTLGLPRWVHARPLVQVSLEKPLGFQARQEMQTQGSSLPLFKREKGCTWTVVSALSPAIVRSSENPSLWDRQCLCAPHCPHSGPFVVRGRRRASRQPPGCCRSVSMFLGLRFGISSQLRRVMPGQGRARGGVAALPPALRAGPQCRPCIPRLLV